MNDHDKSRAQLIAELVELRRRVAEAESAVPEQRMAAALLELAPLGIHVCDCAGRITYVNPSQEAITGYAAEELVGTCVWDRIMAGPDKDTLPAYFRLLAEKQPAPTPYYTKNIRKNGELFDVRIDWNYIRNSRGEVTGFLSIVSDITQQKRAEQELQNARDRLEDQVRERTAGLTKANEQLREEVQQRQQAEEKLKAEQRALRRMVMGSDHERRLIMYELHDGVAQQMMGALMLLESQELRAGPDSQATDVYRDGMNALRQASLELRRVMSRLRTPVLDRLGVAEAIDDVATQLRLSPGAPAIEYHREVRFQRLEPTLENSLFRIAQEAMTNACRHSQSGKVRVQLTQQGEEVTLEVRDWGVGFDPSKVAENRFGLEGIRERVKIMGGKLSIKSGPGLGTVVRVKLPVLEPASP